jgi:hypothetical protein
MPHQAGSGCRLAAALLLIFPVAGAYPQAASDSLPNPYQAIENWAKLPEGRTWGAAAGTSIDRKGNL